MSKPAGKVKLTKAQLGVLALLVIYYPHLYLHESLYFHFASKLDGLKNMFRYQGAIKSNTVSILLRSKLIKRGKGKIGRRIFRITLLGRRALKESSK